MPPCDFLFYLAAWSCGAGTSFIISVIIFEREGQLCCAAGVLFFPFHDVALLLRDEGHVSHREAP